MIKPNKLKIGDKVRIKPSGIKWYLDHFEDGHSLPHLNNGKRVIEFESLEYFAGWRALRAKIPTEVTIIQYGNGGNHKEPNCVYVKVKNVVATFSTYLEEKDLVLVKRGKKRG